jgi:hypothetical protein
MHPDNDLRILPEPDDSQNGRNLAHYECPRDEILAPLSDPDLAVIIAAWHRLPQALRAGIRAMVDSAGK